MHNVKVSKIMIIFESVCMNVLRLLTKNVKHTEQIKRGKTKVGTLMSALQVYLMESILRCRVWYNGSRLM